ncbi:unnamed protein product, partial [Mesorhabditis spiculigera]
MDPSYCVNLRCEWQGTGEHCKPVTRYSLARETAVGRWFNYLSKDESDDELIARIRAEYPVNTFTIVKGVEFGKRCEGKFLWCNSNTFSLNTDYEAFLSRVKFVPPERRPRFRC